MLNEIDKARIVALPRLENQAMPEDQLPEAKFYLLEAPRAAAILYQLTSPRTVQALMVVMLAVVICVLVLRELTVPEVLIAAFSTIVGYYFGVERTDAISTATGKDRLLSVKSSDNDNT